MKVKDFIKKLENLPDWAKEKDVVVIAENGLRLSPEIMHEKIDNGIFDITEKNIKHLIIHW